MHWTRAITQALPNGGESGAGRRPASRRLIRSFPRSDPERRAALSLIPRGRTRHVLGPGPVRASESQRFNSVFGHIRPMSPPGPEPGDRIAGGLQVVS